jgi:hypothetical protein
MSAEHAAARRNKESRSILPRGACRSSLAIIDGRLLGLDLIIKCRTTGRCNRSINNRRYYPYRQPDPLPGPLSDGQGVVKLTGVHFGQKSRDQPPRRRVRLPSGGHSSRLPQQSLVHYCVVRQEEHRD